MSRVALLFAFAVGFASVLAPAGTAGTADLTAEVVARANR